MKQLCITGNNNDLGNWKTAKPLLLTKTWQLVVNKDKYCKRRYFPLVYKYGVYNTKEKTFKYFEIGENRLLLGNTTKENITIIHDGFIHAHTSNWKGAGVAIPVFSLRSQNGLGTGEFTDIKLFVDWANKTGLKLIQLLPVNDTTATHTWKDSYPYSAISAFALHPLYLNLEKLV